MAVPPPPWPHTPPLARIEHWPQHFPECLVGVRLVQGVVFMNFGSPNSALKASVQVANGLSQKSTPPCHKTAPRRELDLAASLVGTGCVIRRDQGTASKRQKCKTWSPGNKHIALASGFPQPEPHGGLLTGNPPTNVPPSFPVAHPSPHCGSLKPMWLKL